MKTTRTTDLDLVEDLAAALVKYANSTPKLLSLLYDMDLMPEEVAERSHDYFRMLVLIEAWRSGSSWHGGNPHGN